jgi:hypothetical protein
VITLDEAKQLRYRDALIDWNGHRWYVNGAVKTWKRDPSRIRVPLKHGLYRYDAITESDFTDGKCMMLTKEG